MTSLNFSKKELAQIAANPDEWTAEQRQRAFGQAHKGRSNLRATSAHRAFCAGIADAIWKKAGTEYCPPVGKEHEGR